MNQEPENQIETRTLKAPNGIEHLISIERKFWDAFDWIIQNDTFTADDLTTGAWQAAKQTENDGVMHNTDNFHAEFSDALRYILTVRLNKIENRRLGLANDNTT